MPIVSVDLACKRYEDIGVVTLLNSPSGIETVPVDLSRRSHGSPTVDALAGAVDIVIPTVNRAAKERTQQGRRTPTACPEPIIERPGHRFS